ncbi:MAG TPA: glycosyltransferase [Azospirillaceae bacterium]|nr:glycosyltransferase [Azospirillaceae bacterium]
MNRRWCVVTPYYKENRDILERCLDSVRRQTVPAEHIVVADGHPQDWLDGAGVRHIRLDRSHNDYGNAARGIGAMLAVAENYDGIAFLDADNWYDPDHVEACLAAADASPARPDFVAAQRRFVRLDGSPMPQSPKDQPIAAHIDTNCYFFFPMSYHVINKWCTIPQIMAAHGDELFYHYCVSENITFAVTDRRTVNYTCLFAFCYQQLNEVPPPEAKPQVNWFATQHWLASLPAEEFAVVQRRTGLYLKMD